MRPEALTMRHMIKLTINENRIELDEAYMQMAEIWARRSKANRKQVGALIVKDKQIISDGYNGMPADESDDVCEYWDWPEDYDGRDGIGGPPDKVLKTKREVLHAESNALMKLAENGGVGAQGATLYVTMSPCFECAKLIKQAKITRVVFREQYRETGGIDFLRRRDVQVDQLSSSVSPPPRPQRPPAPAPVPVAAPVAPPMPEQASPLSQALRQQELDREAEQLIREMQQRQQATQAANTPAEKPVQQDTQYRSSFL